MTAGAVTPDGITASTGENTGRLKSELRRHAAAMTALRGMGVGGAAIDRLHLGLKQPYRANVDGLETRNALCFPVLDQAMRPLSRYGYLNLPDVTINPHDLVGWGPGRPLVYRLGSFATDAIAVVATDVVDGWLAWQHDRSSSPEVAFISRSQPGGWPSEWLSPEWWAGFSKVLLLPGRGAADFVRELAPRLGRDLARIRLPAPFVRLADLVLSSSASTIPFSSLISDTEDWVQDVPPAVDSVPNDRLGRFAAAPVAIAGTWTGGHLYHPFVVENRSVEGTGVGGAGRVVHSWETMVLRSDGLLLTAQALPAPRGTPASERVMALSDGTRVLAPPLATRSSDWSFESISRFVDWRVKGGHPPFRPLCELVADVERFVRSRVRLPVDGHHLLATLYAVLSHVYQVFDAIPLLAVVGPLGTGKSELGEALARVGYASTVAGQLRAAGMIRLLDETRGLLVLDDMDADGAASVSGTGELAQSLKVSYKKSTSRKPLADRGGRVRMVDFFGPKIVTTTRGVDAVLGSRMLVISTGVMPAGGTLTPDDRDSVGIDALRDELRCWAMASATEIAKRYGALPRHIDRRSEIRAPMLVLASLAGEGVTGRLLAVLDDASATSAS